MFQEILQIGSGGGGGAEIEDIVSPSYNTNGTFSIPISEDTKNIIACAPFKGSISTFFVDVQTNTVYLRRVGYDSNMADITNSCEHHEKNGNYYILQAYTLVNGESVSNNIVSAVTLK